MKWSVLLALALVLVATPAQAHGTFHIRDHHFLLIDDSVKARGTYITSRKHAHLRVTVFIVEAGSGRIAEEKSRACDADGCRRVTVQLKIRCVRTLAYYAVIQGDTHSGGHFALWNSRTLVCE